MNFELKSTGNFPEDRGGEITFSNHITQFIPPGARFHELEIAHLIITNPWGESGFIRPIELFEVPVPLLPDWRQLRDRACSFDRQFGWENDTVPSIRGAEGRYEALLAFLHEQSMRGGNGSLNAQDALTQLDLHNEAHFNRREVIISVTNNRHVLRKDSPDLQRDQQAVIELTNIIFETNNALQQYGLDEVTGLELWFSAEIPRPSEVRSPKFWGNLNRFMPYAEFFIKRDHRSDKH